MPPPVPGAHQEAAAQEAEVQEAEAPEAEVQEVEARVSPRLPPWRLVPLGKITLINK